MTVALGAGWQRTAVPCSDPMKILIVTKGHPFEAEPFFAVFDALGHDWTHVEHPDALDVLSPDRAAEFDALVMYDMPGIEFTGGEPPARFIDPGDAFKQQYSELLDAGPGLVFLHHAIASWPAWPQFAEVVGGRFHYQPAVLQGTEWPDSGYLFDIEHTVEVLDPDHPVCAGLEPSFAIVDELYLYPVLTDDMVPLMRSTFDFTDRNFSSADLAIRGTRNSSEGWSHPPGSDLVALRQRSRPHHRLTSGVLRQPLRSGLAHLGAVIADALGGLDLKNHPARRVEELHERRDRSLVVTSQCSCEVRVEPVLRCLVVVDRAGALPRDRLVPRHRRTGTRHHDAHPRVTANRRDARPL